MFKATVVLFTTSLLILTTSCAQHHGVIDSKVSNEISVHYDGNSPPTEIAEASHKMVVSKIIYDISTDLKNDHGNVNRDNREKDLAKYLTHYESIVKGLRGTLANETPWGASLTVRNRDGKVVIANLHFSKYEEKTVELPKGQYTFEWKSDIGGGAIRVKEVNTSNWRRPFGVRIK